jgi:acetyl-CoA carboxylase carboxyltransferase component
MTIRPELIEKLRAKRAKLTENVSPEKLEALHAKGLLSARERLDTLFAEGTSRNSVCMRRTTRPPSAWPGGPCPPTG